ncbi:Zn(II)2Cys6 transcription factor [Aspergillus lucknowensis]|uniref:Zn(2)-C6 fungal-type domain-containing protein n=1 Tax=Aspergillus lucknowensis TaxID=176173 RepID=A0ABR4M1E9_9EURO
MTQGLSNKSSTSSPCQPDVSAIQSDGDLVNREPQRRGPRLAHRKSRNGCQRCRARRVKCDENRPVCRDCHRHGVPCIYDRHEGAVPLPTWIQPGPSVSAEARPEHPLELRLLHHFTIDTSGTMPGTHLPTIKHCWSVDVPRLAFTYKPLQHAIFAISALHISRSESGETRLQGVHRVYLEQALREHRLSVGKMNPQIADAVCFTSILLLVDVFATLQDRPLEPYEPPFEWMHLVRGSVSVFDAALDSIRDCRSAKIWSIVDTFPSPEPAALETGYFSFLLPTIPDEERASMDAYKKAIAYINTTWLAIEAKEHPQVTCRRLMVFPLFVTIDFIHLLQEKRPLALVILAHFLALSATLSDTWWIGRTGHRDILAIKDMLTPQWESLMSWPLDLVALRCRTRTHP